MPLYIKDQECVKLLDRLMEIHGAENKTTALRLVLRAAVAQSEDENQRDRLLDWAIGALQRMRETISRFDLDLKKASKKARSMKKKGTKPK
jgi:hypothetical protein